MHVTISDILRQEAEDGKFVPEIVSTSDYYPFGMLMPERHGFKYGEGWAGGTDDVNGNSVPQKLSVHERSTNAVTEYKASKEIEFLPGFGDETLLSDEFVAYIADETNTVAGNPKGSGGENNGYRYGFNGKENDNEVKGEGNQQDYGMRIYDGRIGKFLSVDPLTKDYPHYTPYSFAGNKPVKFIDLDGLEEAKHWYDYDFGDLMNWFSKPSNPFVDDGFVHKTSSAFNRNFNPLLPATVLLTGYDPSSSDYSPMSKTEAAFTLTTQVVLHKSIKMIGAPNAATQMEQQMAKNAAAMGRFQKTTTQEVAAKTTNELSITAKSHKPQIGASYGSSSYTLSDGKINLNSRSVTNGTFDFIVNNEGKLVIGSGHYNLSGGASTVKAAGQLSVLKGKVTNINNSSGHYQPSLEEAKTFGNTLKNAGIDVSGAKLNLYNASGNKVETIVQQ